MTSIAPALPRPHELDHVFRSWALQAASASGGFDIPHGATACRLRRRFRDLCREIGVTCQVPGDRLRVAALVGRLDVTELVTAIGLRYQAGLTGLVAARGGIPKLVELFGEAPLRFALRHAEGGIGRGQATAVSGVSSIGRFGLFLWLREDLSIRPWLRLLPEPEAPQAFERGRLEQATEEAVEHFSDTRS